VSNVFVPRGAEIVSTKGKVTSWNKTYTAPLEPVDTEIPLVVLTNSGSASAAEIVSGVIQDYDRGVLVGRKTYGKGLVQATRPLSYNSQLKITTAKYYIPSGRCIQAIDYSNRNPDGSIGRIPDSLKVAFQTRNGRKVYDGGGVSPDIVVEERKFASITKELVRKNLIFDFATRFSFENPEISDAKNFTFNKEDYHDFVKWLSQQDVNYSRGEEIERIIKNLEFAAREERYYEDISESLTSLKKALEINKENDLARFRAEITFMLEQEIVSRYYFESGMVETAFDDDEDILAAIKLLDNTEEYQKLLVTQ